jgi:hypothetical protein
MSSGGYTPSGIDWRYTANKVRIGPFDAYIVLPPLLLFLLHIQWWTFFLMLGAITLMWTIELFFSVPLSIALRSIRRLAAGNKRPIVPWWKVNRL